MRWSDVDVAYLITTGLAIFQVIAIVSGGLWAMFKAGRYTQRIDMTLHELKDETRKIGGVLSTLAEQHTRMNQMEKRIDELRHGEGFVLPLPWERTGRAHER